MPLNANVFYSDRQFMKIVYLAEFRFASGVQITEASLRSMVGEIQSPADDRSKIFDLLYMSILISSYYSAMWLSLIKVRPPCHRNPTRQP